MPRERPLLIPLLALVAGLAVSDLYNLLIPFRVVAALLICLLLACLVRNSVPLAICCAVFFFGCGLYALSPYKNQDSSNDSIQSHASSTPVTVEGIIDGRPVSADGSAVFILDRIVLVRDGQTVPAGGRLLINVASGDFTMLRGDRVRLKTRIHLPRLLGLPGEFDYPRYLALREIGAVGRVTSQADVVLMRAADEYSMARSFDQAARRMGDFIRQALPDNRVSSVMTALLLGDQKRIPRELNDAYGRAGVNHILSISGFHVGVIAFFIVQMVILLATRCETLALHFNLRRTALLIALPAMLAYLFLTGAAPATARSVIMLALFVLAMHAERESDPLNALLMAAMLLLIVSPASLFDLSFQLSFLALWGIVLVVPPVMRQLSEVSGWRRIVMQFVVTSCAASAATALPLLFTFSQASLNGIVANFIIVPLLGYGAVLAGFCVLPFIILSGPVAQILLWPAGKLVELSNQLIELFARLPLLQFNGVTRLDMLFFLAFMCSASFLRSSRCRVFLCSAMPAAALAAHLASPSAMDGKLHVTMLSLGQSESLLVRLPDGSTMLVDGGGYLHDNGLDFGGRYLLPALRKLGVTRIDHMVMTHSHPDHIGGLLAVARSMAVGEFMQPAAGGAGEQYAQLMSILQGNHVPRRTLAAGDILRLGDGIAMSVLSPPGSFTRPADLSDDFDMNEGSLVFRLTHGSVAMLFTADTGFPTEQRLMMGGTELSATVLKVGHHGSRHSTSEHFLNKVAPRVALISAGAGNSFGLPAADTLRQLRRNGIQIYRTDLDGTIELTSDGSQWKITTPCLEQLRRIR